MTEFNLLKSGIILGDTVVGVSRGCLKVRRGPMERIVREKQRNESDEGTEETQPWRGWDVRR